jgi:predicted  nucleic acid-binding Zn-ribbon protein
MDREFQLAVRLFIDQTQSQMVQTELRIKNLEAALHELRDQMKSTNELMEEIRDDLTSRMEELENK